MGSPAPVDHTRYPSLGEAFEKTVRRFLKLTRLCVPLAAADLERKAVSKDVDAQLAAAGLDRNDKVLCLGYEVIRRGKQGASSLNTVTLTELLVEKGLDRPTIADLFQRSTETGDPSAWAELAVPKGAAVRR